jgi:thiosulfate/3-mercaptopyruvate sulfurtransferase
MKHIVSADWLNNNLNNSDVRVIHCNGFENYLKEHIPGAFYFDLEEDLSGAVEEHGGRHPLPNTEEFTEKLSTAGIDREVTVVVYDDADGMAASRLWWMLHYLGQEQAYVLDGGFSRWKSLHYDVNSEIPSTERRQFKPLIQHELAVTMEEVKLSIGRG